MQTSVKVIRLSGIKGKTRRHHRVVYAVHHGLDIEIMQGVVMHTCDNPSCINIDHLVLGTHKQNMADMRSKGRAAKSLNNGNGKLSNADKEYIRKHYVPRGNGHLSNVWKLCAKFGVHNTTIYEALKAVPEFGLNMMSKEHC